MTTTHRAHLLLVVAAGGLMAGCGAAPGASGGSTSVPPLLHLPGGSDLSVRADAALGAPVTSTGTGATGFPGMGGWVLTGDLPSAPTSAPVYRWSRGPADIADVRRIAGALGLDGSPVRHAHGWVLSAGSGEIRLRDDGGAWGYARNDTAGCVPVTVDVDSSDGMSGTGCAVAVPSTSATAVPSPPGTGTAPVAPSPSVARAAAAPLFTALGTDLASVTDAELAGSGTITLTSTPHVDGLPTTGLDTTVGVDGHGVVWANGRMTLPTESDVYPLRTARAAFDALASGPRPMIAVDCGVAVPVPAPTDGGGAVSPPLPEVRPSGAPSPAARGAGVPAGSRAPCPTLEPTAVTGARLGLMLTFDAGGGGGGSELLVPAWFLQVAGQQVPTPVIAVDPAFLADPAVPTPASPPASGPGAVPPGDVTVGGSTGGSTGGSASGSGSGGAVATAAPPATPVPAAT